MEAECQKTCPLLCYICKDYGRHKGHEYALMETEAEKMRVFVADAVAHLRKFMEEITETARKLGMEKSLHTKKPSSLFVFLSEEIVEQRVVFGPQQEAGGGTVPSASSNSPPVGTAEQAKQRVRLYFESLREQLKRQETAALTVVDTHIRERLCAIRQQEEDIATILSQVAAVCVHSERVAKQDDAKLLTEAREIREMLDAVEAQRAQVDGLMNSPLDASIPITFTKVELLLLK